MIDDIGLRIAERDAPRAFHDTAPAPLKTIFPTAVTHHITGGRCGHLGDGPHNKPVSRAGRAGSAPGGAQVAFAAKGRAGFGYSTQPRWRRAGAQTRRAFVLDPDHDHDNEAVFHVATKACPDRVVAA